MLCASGRVSFGLAGCIALMSCGGEAVVDPVGGGGAAGGTSSTTTSSTTASTTSSTTTSTSQPCHDHGDCPAGICVFATGQCAPACAPGSCDACGPGTYCEPCATSSCPTCADCVAACMPASEGRCDENDPCPAEQVCSWDWGICLPMCPPNGDCGEFSFCDGCATSSCCGCDDCVAACVGGE